VKGDEDVGKSLKDVREDRVEKKQVHDANVVETATNLHVHRLISCQALTTSITLPSITTELPSKMPTRPNPSQFLNVSNTNACCGSNVT